MNFSGQRLPQGAIADPTLSDRNPPGETPSGMGLRRLQAHRGEPLFLADWERAVFLHFAVDADKLQPWVPFPLDCREGTGWVSLVAFTMRDMRPRAGGKLSRWLCSPIATHAFLNVRTYVRVRGEPGIHFLAEWLPNALAVTLGPRVFGLPYRLGSLDYRHAPEPGRPIAGTVTGAEGGTLRYAADYPTETSLAPCLPGSLDEFLLERYTAFVAWRGGRRGYFRVWHRPWPQARIEPRIDDLSLLRFAPGGAEWAPLARFVRSHYSPGTRDVLMGRPHRLAPEILNPKS